MRKLVIGLLLSSALALGLVQTPATADSWTFRDRSGGRGPLAIRSVKAGHWPSGAPWITVTFDRPLNPSRMGPKDFFVLDYEGNGAPPSEGWIYVVAERGRLKTFEHNPSTGETYSSIGLERPTARSLRVIPWNYNQGGIALAAATYSKDAAAGCRGGCWDFAPNRGYLAHDWTAPQFESFTAPDPDDDFWYEPEIPVTWRITETGFSGLRRTSVVWRDPRATEWLKLVTRRGDGAQQADVEAVEGAHMLLRGVAEDGAGNVGTSYSSILRIPFDDASPSGRGTFLGAWTREDDPGAMSGSVNIGMGPAATFGFSDTADLYCVVVRTVDQQPARIRLQVGDQSRDAAVDVGLPAARFPICVGTEEIAQQSATFVVLAGRIGVDGYWAGEQGSFSARTTSRVRHQPLRHVGGRRTSPRSLTRAAALRPSD